jgi:hypothetical protein
MHSVDKIQSYWLLKQVVRKLPLWCKVSRPFPVCGDPEGQFSLLNVNSALCSEYVVNIWAKEAYSNIFSVHPLEDLLELFFSKHGLCRAV